MSEPTTTDQAAGDAAEVRQRVVSGAANVAARGLAVRAIGLLGNIVLARLLLPSDFGLLAFGLTIAALGSFVTDVGMSAQLIRREAEPQLRELRTLFAFQMTVTTLLTALAAVLLVPRGTSGAIATVFIGTLVLQSLRSPAVVQLERHLTYRPLALAEIGDTLFYTVLSIGLVLAGLGVWGVVLATVVRTLPGTVYLLRQAPMLVLRPAFDAAALRELAGFGAKFQALTMMSLVRDQGINLYTAAASGSTVLGYWSLSQRIMLVPYLLFETLWRVSFPGIARLISHGDDPREGIEKALRLGALATAISLVGLSAAGRLLVPPVFGEQWAPMAVVIPFASLGLVMSGPLSAAGAGYLLALGQAGRMAVALGATLLAWAVLLPLLLPRLGVGAHAAAWLTASVVESVVLSWYLSRLGGVRVLRSLAPPVLLALLTVGPALWLVRDVRPGLLPAGLVGVGSTLVFLLLVAIFRRATLLELVQLLTRMVRGRRAAPAA